MYWLIYGRMARDQERFAGTKMRIKIQKANGWGSTLWKNSF